MKRRELTYLVSGLIIGVILGILIQEAGLLGTAGTKTKATNYYLVELNAVESWLVEIDPANGEKVEEAMRAISSGTFESDVDYLLFQTFATLTGEENVENVELQEGGDTFLCLARDGEISGEPTYYLYLTVPAKKASDLDIPKAWEKLNKPKEDKNWELMACLPGDPES